MIGGGLKAVLTCVNPGQLDERFVGRAFDDALLTELPPGADPCGERGEFHSFCWDGPMFASPIEVQTGGDRPAGRLHFHRRPAGGYASSKPLRSRRGKNGQCRRAVPGPIREAHASR